MFNRCEKDIEDYLHLKFFIFYMIGYLLMVYSSGVVTVEFIDENKEEYSMLWYEYESLEDHKNQLIIRNDKVNYFMLILYFIVNPLIDYVYAYKWFKEGKLIGIKKKDLNKIKYRVR